MASARDMPLDRETLRAVVGDAARAPSSHNTQPWFFRAGDAGVALFADRTRALPVNDPHDRELTISCGCALLNLRVGAAAHGLAARVATLPEPDDDELLARVSLGPADTTPLDADLAPVVETRRTVRQRFAARAVPDDAIRAMVDAAAAEGAWLVPLAPESTRQAAAALVAEGDAIQWADPRWRRELAAWMHPRRRGDGLTVPGLVAPLAQAVVRSFDMGGGVGARDAELADGSPLLAVLGTDGDGPADWLAAGQALERVLLTGCVYGLQASYLNQPIQVAPLRPRLARQLGREGCPQVLLRFGFAESLPPAAPRRPLEDILAFDRADAPARLQR